MKGRKKYKGMQAKCQLIEDFVNRYYWQSSYYYWSYSFLRNEKYNQKLSIQFASENKIKISMFEDFLRMLNCPEQIFSETTYPPYKIGFEQQTMPAQGTLSLPVYINLLHKIKAQDDKKLEFSTQEDDGGYVPVVETYSYQKARTAALNELTRLKSPAFELLNYSDLIKDEKGRSFKLCKQSITATFNWLFRRKSFSARRADKRSVLRRR